MKTLTFLCTAVIVLTVSCDQVPAQIITYGDHHVSQVLRVQYPTQIDSTKNLEWPYENSGASKSGSVDGDSTVMHAVLNQKTGQPYWYVPLPASWKIITRGVSGPTSIEGPNGLIINSLNGQNFVYSENQDYNRVYQENDMQVKKPMTIDSIFSELLIPQLREIGMTLLTHYPLPDVTTNNIAYSRQFSVSTPQNIQKTEGSDWADGEGNKVFIVFNYSEFTSDGIISWGYYLEILKAQPSYFEQAKKEFIHGISNKRFNRNEIDLYNDSIAEQKDRERYTHLYSGDFYRDSTGKIVRDRARLGSWDYTITNQPKLKGSARTPEEIRNDSVNVSLVVNPFDSKEYLVESGFETYWINEKYQYIQSEDTLFDPNTFEAQPGLWQKADVKVNKKTIVTNRHSNDQN